DLSRRAQLLGPVGSVHGARLDEHRGADVMAALDVRDELMEQVALVGNACRAPVPEVMMRIANGQFGLVRLLLRQGQPVIASEGHGRTSVTARVVREPLGWVRARAESSHAGAPRSRPSRV